MTAVLSIVIPAHDEGPLVRRSLERMLATAGPGEFEVVVVANGCADDTAAQAGSVGGVRVVEIAERSKTAALNAGDAIATAFPRAYVDADVDVSTEALRAVARALAATATPCAAAPRLRIDSSSSSIAVRAYYAIWALSDYRAEGHLGSGFYAVNAAGRARWTRFPDVIADDRFVQQRFLPAERLAVEDHVFTVRASRDMATHVARGARIHRGNAQLPASVQLAGQASSRRRYAKLLARVAVRPWLWLSLPFYVYGFRAAWLRSRRTPAQAVWARDESARAAARA